MRTVYVIIAYGGQYEDYCERSVCAYSDIQQALEHMQHLEQLLNKYKDRGSNWRTTPAYSEVCAEFPTDASDIDGFNLREIEFRDVFEPKQPMGE